MFISGKRREHYSMLSVDEEIFKYAPKQLQIIKRYIDKNSDDDKPNYTLIGITLVGMRDKNKFQCTGPFDFQQQGGNASSSGKPKHRRRTKEEKAPEEGDGGGAPAIASPSTATKKKKKHPKSVAPVLMAPGEEVFEEGEAEPPQQEEAKPSLNPDRAMSMARKKKPSRNGATAKAAQHELEGGDPGPLKPVDLGVRFIKLNITFMDLRLSRL